MKRTLCLYLAAFLAVIMLLTSCGRESDGSGESFYAVIADNPDNLDPQLAQDKESYMIIKNIYGTLTDIDKDGRTVNGTAQSYSVSEDGLLYTFKLREGLCWYGLSSEEPVALTAYDYEYAFRRIYSPETHSPHTERFSIIKNSMALYSGELSPDEFGVSACDDLTLTIELEYPNCDFLKLLAHPAASPCCEELFLSTQGRYGLSAKDTYACGAFYVADWNYDPYWSDNHIYLERIKENSLAGYKTYPAGVNVEITGNREEYEAKSGILTDAYAVESIERYGNNEKRTYDCLEYISQTTCLFISPSSPIAEDEEARKALMQAADVSQLGEALSEDSLPACGLIPDAVTIASKSFRELYSETFSEKSSVSLRTKWEQFRSSHSEIDFNSYFISVPDSIKSEMLPYNVISSLEDNLGLYCTAVFEDPGEFEKKISSGNYDICIAPVNADYNLAESFFSEVCGYVGAVGSNLEEGIIKVNSCRNISSKMSAVKSFEDYLISSGYVLPLSFDKKYFLYGKNTEDIWYDPFTDVIFYKYARKNK